VQTKKDRSCGEAISHDNQRAVVIAFLRRLACPVRPISPQGSCPDQVRRVFSQARTRATPSDQTAFYSIPTPAPMQKLAIFTTVGSHTEPQSHEGWNVFFPVFSCLGALV
jgi:hypothetical protein